MSNIKYHTYKRVSCCTFHGKIPIGEISKYDFPTKWKMVRPWESLTKKGMVLINAIIKQS